MHVISRSWLREFWRTHPQAESRLKASFKLAKSARWANFAELRRDFPSADQVGKLTVFDICNQYSLIAAVHFNSGRVFVRTRNMRPTICACRANSWPLTAQEMAGRKACQEKFPPRSGSVFLPRELLNIARSVK